MEADFLDVNFFVMYDNRNSGISNNNYNFQIRNSQVPFLIK